MNWTDYFKTQQEAMVALLERLVQFESSTAEKTNVDKLAYFLKEQAERWGASVTVHERETVGDIMLAKWNKGGEGKPILILSHMDTVWREGALAERPLRIEDGRLFAPGALDMKGGIVIALHAIKGLMDEGLLKRPIWYLLTTDEEEGSHASRALIEELAQEACLVLVTEPPNSDGSLKIWRKGVAGYRLEIEGRAAHAGNEPEMGVNSIIEFAQHALELHALNDLKNGTSVSVTMVEGGSASNVIPPKTVGRIDVRTVTLEAFAKVDEVLMERVPYIPGSKVTMLRESQRPPMQRDDATFEQARRIAQAHGMTIRGEGAGGGSDGNFTAALGIATLDGLGAEGTGMHAYDEHVIIASLPRKSALMAMLIADWRE